MKPRSFGRLHPVAWRPKQTQRPPKTQRNIKLLDALGHGESLRSVNAQMFRRECTSITSLPDFPALGLGVCL